MVTGWVRSDGTNVPYVQLGSVQIYTGTTATAWTYFQAQGTANGAYFRLGSTGTGYAEWDDVTVMDATGDVRITVDPETDWASEQVVDVQVISETVDGSSTIDYSYSYTTEDTIEPALSAARATYATTLRCTFSEGMTASAATGANDALNPSLYTIAPYEPGRQAAIPAVPLSVAQVSATVYDVTVDEPLTFGRAYEVVCGDIADDSANANLLGQFTRTAYFTSWTPPNWPGEREFDLWEMFGDWDHTNDETVGDLERLLSAWQDLVDQILWDLDQMPLIWDIERAPIKFVEAKLRDLGNPFDHDLSDNRKRKLLAVLAQVYKQKGTAEGIINVARFFLGISITEVGQPNLDSWILGESELGIDTYLGPGDSAGLYTMYLNVDAALTDDNRQVLVALVEYMKPAHTHYQIIEPTSPLYIDHWSLGESLLGESTWLH